jgi:hypothetical protein
MTTDWKSLGFDIRIAPASVESSFVQAGQRLEPKLLSPISADSNVWPSPKYAEPFQSGMLHGVMNPLYLYKSISLLIDTLGMKSITGSNCQFVTITTHEAIPVFLNKRYGSGYFEDCPSEGDLVSQGWRHLGFDIVDLNGLISGLKGCGFSEQVWFSLVSLFQDSLNENGLFIDPLKAAQFAQVRGLEIHSHAPFIVVGLLTREITEI